MRSRLVLALLTGAPLPLAFAPFGYFALAPGCVALLFYLWRDARPLDAFWIGLAFGLASFLGGTYWTYISVNGFGGAPILLSLAATLGLVAVLALFVASAGWLAAQLRCNDGPRAWLLVLPAAWVLTEWARGWMFTGFGWLSLGYSQTDSWLMAYAPVFGLHGVSFAVAVTAGAALALVVGTRAERLAAFVTLAVVWSAAWMLRAQDWTSSNGRSVSVALVQGSVTQDLKWLPSQFPRTLNLYRDLTAESAGHDLIIWPEVAIPSTYDVVEPYLDAVKELASAERGTVVLGILKRDSENGAAQNAVVALTETPQFYIKRHLVPFGEYFPVPEFIREWFQSLGLPYTDVSAGSPDQPLLSVGGERAAVTICYEDVFGIEQLAALPDASLLINVSNDAWFGDSLAPHQHLQIARVRAAEVGRYLLRSTNTGITAVIDPRGAVIAAAPAFETAILRATVQGFSGSTPYVRWANYPVLAAIALVLLWHSSIAIPLTGRTKSSRRRR